MRWGLAAAALLVLAATSANALPGTGTQILTDASGDYSAWWPNLTPAADMVRVGVTDDASNVIFWIKVPGQAVPPGPGIPTASAACPLDAAYGCDHVAYSIGFEAAATGGTSSVCYSVAPEYALSTMWTANNVYSGVCGVGGAGPDPLAVTPVWVCDEARITIPRNQIGSPANGGALTTIEIISQNDNLADYTFDTFSTAGTYTLGTTPPSTTPVVTSVTAFTTPTPHITVTWTAPMGGPQVTPGLYNIYRATSAGGPYTLVSPIGGVPGFTWDDTTGSAGTTYHYKVRAIWTCNRESADSNILNAVFPGTPTPPTCAPGTVSLTTGVSQAFTATAGNGIYSWSAPSGSPSSGSSSSFSTSYSAIGTYTVTVTSGSLTATCSVTVSAPVAGALGVTITSGPNFNVNINTNLAVFAVISNMNGPLGSDTCTWSITPSTGVTMTPLVSVTSCTSLTADSIQFLTTTPGTYTLTIVVDDDGAGPRTASASATITAIDPNALGVDIAGSGEATVGQAHVLAATLVTGNNASPVTCSWTITPALPFTANGCTSISFTPGGPGQYRITVSATRGTGANNNAVDEFYVFATVNGDAAVDTDKDGFADSQDNCPVDYNPGQYDSDGNGQGDMCEAYATEAAADDAKGETTTEEAPDADKDGVADVEDNCPQLANSSQANLDADQLGDACDSDADGDRIADTGSGVLDNCRLVYNPLQEDRDQDGQGDACDIDGIVILANDNAQAGHASSQTCPSCSKEVATATEEGLPVGMLFVAGLAALGGMLAAVLALNRK